MEELWQFNAHVGLSRGAIRDVSQDPPSPTTHLKVPALLLPLSRGSDERGLGAKVSITVWEFPSARPNLLISGLCRGSEHCG